MLLKAIVSRTVDLGAQFGVGFKGLGAVTISFNAGGLCTIKMKGISGQSIGIGWGELDGDDVQYTDTINFNGELQTVTHTYATGVPATPWQIAISGRLDKVIEIELETTGIEVDLNDFVDFENIEIIKVVNDVSGITDYEIFGETFSDLIELWVDTVNEYNTWWELQITGQDTETQTDGTLVFSATADVVVEVTGDVSFADPENPVARANDPDATRRVHTVVFNITRNGSGTIRVKEAVKVVSLGHHNGASVPNIEFMPGTSNTNATSPIVALNFNTIPRNIQKIRQATAYTNILPATGTRALPTGMTYLALRGLNIKWTYSGALPTGLTDLHLNANGIIWTYTGALPTGLTDFRIDVANNVEWTYDGAFPTGLAVLIINGSKVNWTGLDIGNTGTMTFFNLGNYRIAKMSSDDLIILLTQMKDSDKVFPATCTINDYADWNNLPQGVIDARAALLAAKTTIVTLALGA